MKIKWICLIGFVFLFVSMACVSAEDNATAVEMPHEDVIEESPAIVDIAPKNPSSRRFLSDGIVF